MSFYTHWFRLSSASVHHSQLQLIARVYTRHMVTEMKVVLITFNIFWSTACYLHADHRDVGYHRSPLIVAGPQIFERGRRKTMYQPRRHLSQMHTTNYIPLMREKGAYWRKNSEPKGRGAVAPTTPLNSPLAPDNICYAIKILSLCESTENTQSTIF